MGVNMPYSCYLEYYCFLFVPIVYRWIEKEYVK
ncbi:Uncharacterised protein [Segatella copri]|nr:Uncharacterised protein [Segatella copri]